MQTILLTNDDGIGAPGMEALVNLAEEEFPGARIVVSAPDRELSGCGHRVTRAEPFSYREVREDRIAVSGTPADCVRLAIFGLGIQPDLVFSGINKGGNMGQDLVISGTVAGAREAAYHRIPAVAISHYTRDGLKLDWDWAVRASATGLAVISPDQLRQPDGFWNINLPHLDDNSVMPSVRSSIPEREPLLVDYEIKEGVVREIGPYQDRPQSPGSDVAVCFGGEISLSRVTLHKV